MPWMDLRGTLWPRLMWAAVALPLWAASPLAAATASGGEPRPLSSQDLFLACLSGYVSGHFGARDEAKASPALASDPDLSARLASELLRKVYRVCPPPMPGMSEKSFSDPEAPMHRWMLTVTQQMVISAAAGEPPRLMQIHAR